jgi:heat shock protein HspQ
MIMFAGGSAPRFTAGDLVAHRRYGYRGVIVAVDPQCLAPEDWYQANNTQPDRNQAWYHVLVHGSSSNTYAAESSLDVDPDGKVVDHPLVHHFFDEFVDGRYQRNDRPWPG